MNILLDVLGGDNSPDEFIKGAVEALDELEKDTVITLVGKEDMITAKIKEFYDKELSDFDGRIKIKNATDEITNHDAPLEAIKTKTDSTMCVAFKMLKDNEADALVSAGNTGALMAGGLLKVGRIKGVDRPALCPLLPTLDGVGFILLDAGANTNCKPINLVQFAQMGSIYMKKAYGIDNPPVGLLNIGAEAEKGNQLTKDTYPLLKDLKDINFYGNIEGRYMFDGDVRVVVSDGYTGNIALKTTEGIGLTLGRMLKQELTKGFVSKIGALFLKASGAIEKLRKRMDYSEYGGAVLLGIEKTIVKCHGSGKAKDVRIVLKQAEATVKGKVTETIIEKMSAENVEA